jgi:osmotically-inducible protein OsmY
VLSEAAIVDCIVAAAKDQKFKDGEEDSIKLIDDIILAKRTETELLKSGNIESLHLKISAYNGVVHLSGHVHSEEELAEAARIADGLKDVKSVINDLQVVSFKKYKE